MNTPFPSTSPVAADDLVATVEERLHTTGWWLPDSAEHLSADWVDDTSFQLITNTVVITFTASRDDVLAMLPYGGGGPYLKSSDLLNADRKRLLAVSGAPEHFQIAPSTSQSYPFHMNVLILPDEGDRPQVTVLSYYQAR